MQLITCRIPFCYRYRCSHAHTSGHECVTAVTSPAIALGHKALHCSVQEAPASWGRKAAGAATQWDPAKASWFCSLHRHFQRLTMSVVNRWNESKGTDRGSHVRLKLLATGFTEAAIQVVWIKLTSVTQFSGCKKPYFLIQIGRGSAI